MLQMEELIQRIDAADGLREHDFEDRLGTEIKQVLDHLRGTLNPLLHRRLKHGIADPSSRDPWLH